MKALQQHEPPVVLVGSEHLPAAFVIVPVAPDPISARELGRQQAGGLVQLDYLLTFGWRVTDRVPDRLRWLGGVGRIGVLVEVVEDRPATLHFHPAVRFAVLTAPRRIAAAAGRLGVDRATLARSPRAGQFEDAEAWPIAEPHNGPLQPHAAFLPQDAGRAERRAP